MGSEENKAVQRRIIDEVINRKNLDLADELFSDEHQLHPVHLSLPAKAHLPANALYSAQPDLVLLWVDPIRLKATLRYEAPEPGAPQFPHLYGPLNLDAVVAETRLEPWEQGAFALPQPGRVIEL